MADLTFDPAEVDAILASTGRERRHIVAVLSRIQDRYHYLPEAALRRVVETSGITAADIEGVATFYTRFRRKPAGRHTIRVCVGTACYVKGGENIYDAFRLALRSASARTPTATACSRSRRSRASGAACSPRWSQIDDAVYGHLTRQTVPAVLRDFLASRAAAAGDPGPSRPDGRCPSPRARWPCAPARSCRASGAAPVFDAFVREAKERRLGVEVRRSGCSGISYRLPSRR